jgi:hypothetical protein
MMGGDTDGLWTVIKNAVNGEVTALMEDEKEIGVSDDSGDDLDQDNIGP